MVERDFEHGFQKAHESLVILFSSRLASQTHILAVFLLDREFAERYRFCRRAAEAKLTYFSWHWRFAVIFSVAKVIFGKQGESVASTEPLARYSPYEDGLMGVPVTPLADGLTFTFLLE